jgi:hypothetical protein
MMQLNDMFCITEQEEQDERHRAPVYTCSVCGALVDSRQLETHRDWHADLDKPKESPWRD